MGGRKPSPEVLVFFELLFLTKPQPAICVWCSDMNESLWCQNVHIVCVNLDNYPWPHTPPPTIPDLQLFFCLSFKFDLVTSAQQTWMWNSVVCPPLGPSQTEVNLIVGNFNCSQINWAVQTQAIRKLTAGLEYMSHMSYIKLSKPPQTTCTNGLHFSLLFFGGFACQTIFSFHLGRRWRTIACSPARSCIKFHLQTEM